MKTIQVDRDYLETLKRRIETLEARVKQLEESQRTYVPIYDKDNFPTVAAEGEICISAT